MRRALAMILLVVISGPLFAPLLTAMPPDDAALPPCCRRNGKHHCAMYFMMREMAARNRIVTEKCPYSPFAALALMVPHVFFSQVRNAYTTHTAVEASPAAQAEAGYRISFHRSRQKRGPPQQFFL